MAQVTILPQNREINANPNALKFYAKQIDDILQLDFIELD